MKTTRYAVMVVLFVLLAASFAQADVPWADSVIHTNPVLSRGLGPEMVTQGYAIVPLSNTDQNGQPVNAYTSWMTGRSGETVTVKFRPGEPVEAIKTGSRTVNGQPDCQWLVETWHAKRIVRCGNPTSINFYVWRKIEIRTVLGPVVQLPGKPYPVPEPYPVYQTVYQTEYVFAPMPRQIEVPQSQTLFYYKPGLMEGLLKVAAAYVGRTRISINATGGAGGTANSSAAASSSNTNINRNSNNNVNTNVNNNQMQQQQQVYVDP